MIVNNLKNGTKNPKTKKRYSVAFKKRTVQYFLSGAYTALEIRKKYHVPEFLLKNWRKWYFRYFESKYLENTLKDEQGKSRLTQGAYRAIRTSIERENQRIKRLQIERRSFGNNDSIGRKKVEHSSQKKLWHETVSEIRHEFPFENMDSLCSFFGKSRQAWYKAQTKKITVQMKEMLIVAHVQHTRKYMPRIGGRKMHYMFGGFFKQHNIKIGRDKFFDLLRHNNLLRRKKRFVKRTTNSNHSFKKHPNLIKKLTPTRPNQLWVSDITYIRTGGRIFSYLSLITDAYSRKIVGWYLSEDLKAEGTITALKMALKQTDHAALDLAHHSDRGIQYCCKDYIKLLVKNNIRVSMTEQYDPYENAMAERINRTIKEEFLEEYFFYNHDTAKKAVCKAIKIYNEMRPHQSINYLTPNEAHKRTGELNKRWKKLSKITKMKSSGKPDERA